MDERLSWVITWAKMVFIRLNAVLPSSINHVGNYVLEMYELFHRLKSYDDVVFVCGNEATGNIYS
jgi:hypothetical protein